MSKPSFVYVTYIRTTAEKLWRALTEPEFTRQYWAGTFQECEWKQGAAWRIMIPDGRLADHGEVLEIEPHRRLVLSWQNEFKPELRAEGFSRLTYQLEQQGDMVRLTVTHGGLEPGGIIKGLIGEGWPALISSLKSLLETGEELPEPPR